MPSDAEALEPLLSAMAAAGRHDTEGVITAFRDAERHLRAGHRSLTDTAAGILAAGHREWGVCWGRAYQAICGLAHVFPPDPAACPPPPTESPTAAVGATCGGCGAVAGSSARFCSSCGNQLATADTHHTVDDRRPGKESE